MISFPKFRSNEELGSPKTELEQQGQSWQEPLQPETLKPLSLRSLQPTHLDLTAATNSPIDFSIPCILVEPPAPTSPEFPASHDALLSTPTIDSDLLPENCSCCPVCEMPIPLPLTWDLEALLQDPTKEMYRALEEMMLEMAGEWNARGKEERAAVLALLREIRGHLEVEMERLKVYLKEKEA